MHNILQSCNGTFTLCISDREGFKIFWHNPSIVISDYIIVIGRIKCNPKQTHSLNFSLYIIVYTFVTLGSAYRISDLRQNIYSQSHIVTICCSCHNQRCHYFPQNENIIINVQDSVKSNPSSLYIYLCALYYTYMHLILMIFAFEISLLLLFVSFTYFLLVVFFFHPHSYNISLLYIVR